jgi:hypothetical protein
MFRTCIRFDRPVLPKVDGSWSGYGRSDGILEVVPMEKQPADEVGASEFSAANGFNSTVELK